MPNSGPNACSDFTPGPAHDRVEREPVAVGEQRAGERLELVDREDRADLLELAGRLGVGLQRLLDERLEVDVEVAEPLLLELVDRLLVALVVGERVAVRGLDGALELRLGADREEVADDAGRHALVVDLVVDVLVGALRDLAAVGLDALVDRLLRLLGVLGGDEHDVAGIRLVDARDPHAGLLAQPRRDVLLVGDGGAVGLLQRLVEQLTHLALRVVGAQDLAGGVEDVVALVALGPHDALEVDRRAGRDRLGGIGVGGAAARAAAGGDQDGEEEQAGEGQEAGARHPSRVGRRPADCNSWCRRAPCMTSCVQNRRRGPHPTPRRNPRICRENGSCERTSLKLCGTNDDNCVAEWDRVGYLPARNSRSGVAGLLPLRHLGSTRLPP